MLIRPCKIPLWVRYSLIFQVSTEPLTPYFYHCSSSPKNGSFVGITTYGRTGADLSRSSSWQLNLWSLLLCISLSVTIFVVPHSWWIFLNSCLHVYDKQLSCSNAVCFLCGWTIASEGSGASSEEKKSSLWRFSFFFFWFSKWASREVLAPLSRVLDSVFLSFYVFTSCYL
jgi:hypothetical protein